MAAGALALLLAGLALLVSEAARADETMPVKLVAVGSAPAGAKVLDLVTSPTFASVRTAIAALKDGAPASTTTSTAPGGTATPSTTTSTAPGGTATANVTTTMAPSAAPIYVPLGIPGLPDLDLPSTSLSVVDSSYTLVLRSHAEAFAGGASVDASVVLDWADAADTTPEVAVVLHGSGLELSKLNPSWPNVSVLPRFEDAWVMLTPSAHTLDVDPLTSVVGDALPPVDVELTGGVTFRGMLDASGTPGLREAFRAAGLNPGTLLVTGSLGVDGSLLAGTGTPGLHLSASATKDPGAPTWLKTAEATASLEVGTTGATLEVGGTYGIDLGGTTSTFTGGVKLDASTTAVEVTATLAHTGTLKLPAPLEWVSIDDASVELRYANDALDARVKGAATAGASHVQIDGHLVVGSGTVGVDLSVVGPVDAADVARLVGEALGTVDPATIDGLRGIVLQSLSLKATNTSLSGSGTATIKGVQAGVLLSASKPTSGPVRLLAAFNLQSQGKTLGDLVGPAIGDVAGALPIPDVDLVFVGGSKTLGAADLGTVETAYFTGIYGADLSGLSLRPGLSLAAKVRVDGLGQTALDLFGLSGGQEVLLDGYVGTAMGTVAGDDAGNLPGLALRARLPQSSGSSLLPSWMGLSSQWTLDVKAVASAVQVEATAKVTPRIGTTTFPETTIVAAFSKDGAGTRASLDASLAPWNDPFGVTWFDLDELKVSGSIDVPSGGKPQLAASVTGAFTVTPPGVGPKRFSVELALESGAGTKGTFTAKLESQISVADVVRAVGADPSSLPGPLSGAFLGPVTIKAQVSSTADPSISVSAIGGIPITSDFTLAGRAFLSLKGSAFTLGIRPQTDGDVSLFDILPASAKGGLPASLDVPLPTFGAVFSSATQAPQQSSQMDAEARDFFAPLYGCSTPGCTFDHQLDQGFTILSSIKLPTSVTDLTKDLNIDLSRPVLMRGSVPLFGGSSPANLSIVLPAPKIAGMPEFLEDAALKFKLDTAGLTLGGELALKMPRPTCDGHGVKRNVQVVEDGQVVTRERCYDILRFGMSGSVVWTPQVSIQLTGEVTADGPNGWMSPFGVGDWIGFKRIAAQFQVIPSTATLGLGFSGDFRVAGKDFSGSIAVALNIVAPSPPFVVPELLGFRLSSTSGMAFQDLVDVQHEFAKAAALITGQPTPPKLDLAATSFPNLALRNIDLMYARQTSPGLCLETGFAIAADLYVNPTDAPGQVVYDGTGKCRALPSKAQSTGTTPLCATAAEKAKGCFASVLLQLTQNGIVARGNLTGFAVGPLSWRDSYLSLGLSLAEEPHLAVKGGAKIDGFLEGNLDLHIDKTGLKLEGDVDLFAGAAGAYIYGSAPLDLSNPQFEMRASLHADFADRLAAAIDQAVRPIRDGAIALDTVWDTALSLADSSTNKVELIRGLPAKLRAAGVQVDPSVDSILNVAADIEKNLGIFGGGSLVVDTVLNGLKFPDYPGNEIGYTPPTPRCMMWWVQGKCWFTPPVYFPEWWFFGIHVPARWDYTFAIEIPITQPACIGSEYNGKCYSLWLTPKAGPRIPGVCAYDARLASLVPNCKLRDVTEKVIGPSIGKAFSAITGLPAPENAAQALDQLTAGMKGLGSAVRVECMEFGFKVGAGQGAPGADLRVAVDMDLFGNEVKFGSNWKFNAQQASVDQTVRGLLDSLLNPQPVSCTPRRSPASSALTLAANESVVEGGTVEVTGTFAADSAAPRTVSLSWGDGSAPQVITATGKTFTARRTFADDDPTGTAGALYVLTATYEGTEKTTASRLVTVLNGAPSNLTLAVPAITEGGTAVLHGSFVDAGAQDTHEVQIDWGDGTAPQVVALAAGARSFEVTRPFAVDGSFPITVTVVDDDTGRTSALGAVVVANDAPGDVVLGTDVSVVDEGGSATLSGTFTDDGVGDQHTVTVDWGDGSAPEDLPIATGERAFVLRHRWADDAPGSAPDLSKVKATVEDEAGASGTGTLDLPVRNVAPVDVSIGAGGTSLREGDAIRIGGGFGDPGLDDAHTVVIAWGDGTPATTLQLPAGDIGFEAEHTYRDDEPTKTASDEYEVTVTVTDDDGGRATGTGTFTVEDQAPTGLAFAPTVSRVDEAATVTYRGSFTDPGPDDSHSVVIDWGDGTDATEVEVEAGAPRSFELTHVYADDGASGDPVHRYPVSMAVTDDDTRTTVLAAKVEVHNVDPSAVKLVLDRTAVDENQSVELTGTFVDPGLLDSHTVVLDWGDGSAPTRLAVEADGRDFAATHRYLDDDPTGTRADKYRIAVAVTDDDTGTGRATVDVAVADVAPLLGTFAPATDVAEGAIVRYAGTFTDPGTKDRHRVTVDWGDSTADAVVDLVVGARAFTVDHVYVDDDPTGSAKDVFRPTVTIVDDDTLSDDETHDVEVLDVAPSKLALTLTPAALDEDGTTVLSATFADPGLRDTFTAKVDWGEGTVDTIGIAAGGRAFGARHRYGDDGTFPVSVVVTDDDTLAGTAATRVTVANVAPTVGVDRTSAQWAAAAGGPTTTSRIGEASTFKARAQDPGSDDLIVLWTWGDGASSTGVYRNAGTGADPDPSPTVGRRDVTDTQSHAWSKPCLYRPSVVVDDDDTGRSPIDQAWVIVTGTGQYRRGPGWWYSRFDAKGGNDLGAETQTCYLRIAEHASTVFGEVRPAGTPAQAAAVLKGAGSDQRAQLDRALLGLWLDYANGAFRWNEPVDTNLDGRADAVFADVMAAAEKVRLDPTATSAQLISQRQRLTTTTLPGRRGPADDGEDAPNGLAASALPAALPPKESGA